MSAHEALGRQFVSHTELSSMYSADFDVPMHQALGEMDEYHHGLDPFKHPGAVEHGSSTAYVEHLSKDIKNRGMQEPITVRGGNVVKDGHHRALAAMRLHLERVPVRHIQ